MPVIVNNKIENDVSIDQRLIHEIKSGNKLAFKELVSRYKDMIYTVCLRFLKNPTLAEDAAQDVFVSIYENIDFFEHRSTLKTWMYQIAVNRSLQELRSQKRKMRWAKITSIFSNEEDSEKRSFTESISDRSQQPDQIMSNNELGTLLYKAMDKLNDTQRTAFVLTQIEGHSYEETARIMECSLSSVESLIFRARNQLKKRLSYIYDQYIKEEKL